MERQNRLLRGSPGVGGSRLYARLRTSVRRPVGLKIDLIDRLEVLARFGLRFEPFGELGVK